MLFLLDGGDSSNEQIRLISLPLAAKMCTNKNKTPTGCCILFNSTLKMYAVPHTPLLLITPEILFFIASAGPRGSLQTGGRDGTIITRMKYRRNTGESQCSKQREAGMRPFVR